MTASATVLFCGAGGDSLGAQAAGMQIVMAANHWQTAIDVHQANFPDAGHDCADISQADPRRYPVTDVLLASPECTNHSQARGVSRLRQNPSLWDAPDPAAERSRATMWDVVRFAEQIRYKAMVVENVVEATKWVGWRAWHIAMEDLGYEHRVLSHNSMHHGVPQSRDRIYVVFWRKGLRPNLELEVEAHCGRCDAPRTVRQAWKQGRSVGRYRQQWAWTCTVCGSVCEPATRPAADIIDWGLPCPRIGDRARPLAPATRARILAGLQRYGWAPVITAGAGHVHERTPGNRSKPLSDPLPVQSGTATQGLAMPPTYVLRRFTPRGRTGQMMTPVDQELPTCGATGGQFLVQPHHGGDDQCRVRGVDEVLWTVSASDDRPALVVTNRAHHTPRPVDDPLSTICAGGNHHGLLMRNNGGGAEMVTPADEPARTVTARCAQSLLVPYNGKGRAQPVEQPIGTVTGTDRHALVDVEQIVDDCGFRMLEPHEIAAAMAFPDHYIPAELTKRDRVKLAGNAVTPPVAAWITGRVLQALEGAA